MITGTMLIAAVAIVFAVPLATGVALYISEYAPRRIRRGLINLVDLMAAVSSVVYGLWGFILLQEHIIPLARFLSSYFGGPAGWRAAMARRPSGRHRLAALVAVLAVVLPMQALLAPSAGGDAQGFVPISGSGSTWSQNALDQWRRNVNNNYGITVNFAGNGSTAGRNDFKNGQVDFAVSEIPYGLSDGGLREEPPERAFGYMPTPPSRLVVICAPEALLCSTRRNCWRPSSGTTTRRPM